MNILARQLGVNIMGILAICFATQAIAAKPVTNVTTATGGSAISNSNIASSTWTTLTGPILSETGNQGIATGTVVLNAPTGFQFNTAAFVTVAVTKVSGTSGSNITLTSYTATVSATAITINVASADSGNTQDSLTWSGIQVMPTGCLFPATNPGNLTISGTSITTGGTNLNTTNAGALTETSSTALTFIQQPTNTLINAVISPAVTINACGNGASLPNVTVALTAAGGAILAGTLTATTNNSTGLASFSNLSVNLAGGYTLTTTSPALTSAISSSFSIIAPLAYYHMDESAWTGLAGQVIDSSGNGNNAQAFNGATTASATPAITSSPGTCG
jgi:hypothetical protein